MLTCINEIKVEITANFFHSATGESIPEQINLHHINLVYLDIELPHTRGLELLQQIRKAKPDTMVVMVSGENLAENVTTAIKTEANGSIDKPFNSGRILDLLNSYLKKTY